MTRKKQTKRTNNFSKLSSRKFQVWLIWTILTVLALFVTDMEVEIKSQIVQFYGWVSLIYVGGNVVQKYITNRPNFTSINDEDNIK